MADDRFESEMEDFGMIDFSCHYLTPNIRYLFILFYNSLFINIFFSKMKFPINHVAF